MNAAPKKTGKRGIKPAPDEGPTEEELDAYVAAVKAKERIKPAEPLKVPASVRRQAELPGMEDKHLVDIEEAADNYAKVRDRRIALLQQEIDLKGLLLDVMRRHKREHYRCEEMDIQIVRSVEKIKVKIIKDED